MSRLETLIARERPSAEIVKMFGVEYASGWDVDNSLAVINDAGTTVVVTTDHGRLVDVEDIEQFLTEESATLHRTGFPPVASDKKAAARWVRPLSVTAVTSLLRN